MSINVLTGKNEKTMWISLTGQTGLTKKTIKMDKLCNLAELFEWIEMIKLSFDWKNE